MKRGLAVFLATIMVLSVLSGCRSKTQDGSASKTAGGSVTLKWSYWVPEPTATIAKFNKEHPNIKLEYEMLSSDQYVNIINTRLMSGEGPDIFSPRFIDNYEKLISDGAIVDLTDKKFLQNYLDSAMKQLVASNGKTYGFPDDILYLFCYYNKDIFKANNLSVPTNWEEYMDVCAKLKAAGIVPQVQGMKDLWQCKYVGPDPIVSMTQTDPSWGDKLSAGKVKFTDADVVSKYQRIADFIGKGYLMNGSLSLTFVQAWQMFCDGKAAMMAGGTWYTSQAFPSATPKFDFDVMPIPFNEKGQSPVVPLGAISGIQVINKKSSHVNQALQFAEWFSQTENLQVYANDTKQISAGKNVKNEFADELTKYEKLLKATKNIQFVKEPSTITTYYGQVIQNMVLGTMTPQQVCAGLQDQVNQTVLKK